MERSRAASLLQRLALVLALLAAVRAQAPVKTYCESTVTNPPIPGWCALQDAACKPLQGVRWTMLGGPGADARRGPASCPLTDLCPPLSPAPAPATAAPCSTECLARQKRCYYCQAKASPIWTGAPATLTEVRRAMRRRGLAAQARRHAPATCAPPLPDVARSAARWRRRSRAAAPPPSPWPARPPRSTPCLAPSVPCASAWRGCPSPLRPTSASGASPASALMPPAGAPWRWARWRRRSRPASARP